MAILPPPRRRPEDSTVPVPMQAPPGIGASVAAGMSQDAAAGRRDAATANLAKPMDQLRTEAYGGPGFSGPMPGGKSPSGLPAPMRPQGMTAAAGRPFNAQVQNQLGSMTFRNLQPRNGAPATPAAAAPEGMEMSSAGFTPYAEEQIGGAPRRLSGFAGRRAGARYTEGAMRGKTQDQAFLAAREKYATLPPDQKARYEAKARRADISSAIPGIGQTPAPATPEPEAGPRFNLNGAPLAPLRPGLQPNLPADTPMPKIRKSARYAGDSGYDEEE